MQIKTGILISLAVVLVESGCGTPEPSGQSSVVPQPAPLATAPQPEPAPPSDTIARIHWAGQRAIAADPNGLYLKGVWELPASAPLKAQVLDKASLGPWRLLHRSIDTNAAARLRPLLEDVFTREYCLEIQQASNQPGQLAFAIRLDDARAALWETNLAAVLESLTAIRPTAATGGQHGWTLKKHQPPNLLELARVGDWTVLGAAQDRNSLLDAVRGRIHHQHTPVQVQATNAWLEAELDVRRIADALALGWNLPADLPKISLAAVGQGTNVWTQGVLNFPKPLPLELEPWNIPTNLLDQGLASFTCLRGVKPWLASLKAWNDLQIGPPPDQVCCWALRNLLMQTYFTAPLPDASNQVSKLTELELEHNEKLFGDTGAAGFRRSTTTGGLEWDGIPYLFPYLQSLETSNGVFAFGGMFPYPEPEEPLTSDALPKALSQTNLVYHDWEITGSRTEQLAFIGQFIRFAFQKAQFPNESVSLEWIRKLEPLLGPCVTDVTQTAPNQLAFNRQSTIGLTGFELNLLADWLESPRFPIGLYSLLASPAAGPTAIEPAAAPPPGAK